MEGAAGVSPVSEHSFDILPVEGSLDEDDAARLAGQVEATQLEVTASLIPGGVRVSGRSKDDLQEVIRMVRAQGYGVPLEFTNYR